MINVYAAINKNIDERMQSASGGIMTLLAKRAIERMELFMVWKI